MAARLAGLFAAGIALAAGAGLGRGTAPPDIPVAHRNGARDRHGGDRTRYCRRLELACSLTAFIRPTWLNQASISFALLVWPASAVLISLGQTIFAALLAVVTAVTVYALAGTSAKVVLLAGLAMGLLLYRARPVVARAALVISIIAVIAAPLTFARARTAARSRRNSRQLQDFRRSPSADLVVCRRSDRRAAGYRLGLGLVARHPGRRRPDQTRRDLDAVASAQCGPAGVARTRCARCGAVCAAGSNRLGRTRPRRVAAAVRAPRLAPVSQSRLSGALPLTAYGRSGGSALCRSRFFWSWSWRAWANASKAFSSVRRRSQSKDRQADQDENDDGHRVSHHPGEPDPRPTMLLEIGIDYRHHSYPLREDVAGIAYPSQGSRQAGRRSNPAG